ncbi:MAG TPA: ABATE domain-containing protein [Terriglobales bacterium]|nr:ABATE domain-containing protein [Terriglobales bacterium]
MAKMQNEASEQRDGFFFLGNHLALDFLNTKPVLDEVATELLPDLASILRWFVSAGLLTQNEANSLLKECDGSASAKAAVQTIRDFREKLRKVVAGWETGERIPRRFLEELNSHMVDYPLLHRVAIERERSDLEIWFRPSRPESLIGPLAYEAAKLLTQEDSAKVRQCGGCVLHFLDISKKGTRHWCSMRFCGNRNKAAAFAARQRAAR